MSCVRMYLSVLYRRFDADETMGLHKFLVLQTLRFVVDAFAHGNGIATQKSLGSSGTTKGNNTMLGMLVSEVPEASEFEAAFEDATGSTGDRTGKRGGWTLGRHMDRLTASSLAGDKKRGGVAGRSAFKLGRIEATTPKYSCTSVMHMKDIEEPPDIPLAAVVLAAHECSLRIVTLAQLTIKSRLQNQCEATSTF